MKKVSTFLPLFSGFYGSHWDEPCFDGEDEHFELPDGMEFWEHVDWNKYHYHIAKEMCSEVKYLLSDFVNDITFERVASPKYYNFENDAIHCEIDFNRNLVESYINANKEAFDKYIKDRYTSRDGFISYYENDGSQFLDGWHDDSHKVGSVLQFICDNEGYEEPWDLSDCHVSMFYKDEIYQYERSI
jgi:hypothetical protein